MPVQRVQPMMAMVCQIVGFSRTLIKRQNQHERGNAQDDFDRCG